MTSLPISIVMPTLNSALTIEAAVESVLGQGPDLLELIIVDRGSTDGTVEQLQQIACQDERVEIVVVPDALPAGALNLALKKVRGTIVGWLDGEDRYANNCFDQVSQYFRTNSASLMLYGQCQRLDEAGNVLGTYPTLLPGTPLAELSPNCVIRQSTTFFRRTCLLLLGDMEEDLESAFGLDYSLRAFNTFSERIGFVESVLSESRSSAALQHGSRQKEAILESMQVLFQHLGSASDQWVLFYVEEMLSEHSAASDDRSQKEEALHFLEAVREFLTDEDYVAVKERITRDGRFLRDDSALKSLNVFSLNEATVMEIVESDYQIVKLAIESTDINRYRVICGSDMDKDLALLEQIVAVRNAAGRIYPKVYLDVTLMPCNIEEMSDFVKFAARLGVNRLCFKFLQDVSEQEFQRFLKERNQGGIDFEEQLAMDLRAQFCQPIDEAISMAQDLGLPLSI